MAHDPFAPKHPPIIDLHQRPPTVVRPLRPLEPQPTVQAEEERFEPTDLQQIARWFKFLPYDDMKTFATDVMGDKKIENAGDLADLVNDWQKRTIGAVA